MMTSPAPRRLLSLALRPKTAGDAERLGEALRRLSAEDVYLDSAMTRAGGVVIRGVSEEHLEVVVDRLHREFYVDASLGLPEVVHREALTRSAEGEAKHVSAAMPREYAHVKLRLHPAEVDCGIAFVNQITGGAIPAQFIPSVEAGIRDRLASGVIAGSPIADARVELYGGSYHEVDSNDAAFRRAGFLAAEQAALAAQPVLLEPLMRLEVAVPADFGAPVIRNVLARRGDIHDAEQRGETVAVTALVRLSMLFGYATDLRARTIGRGTFVMQFERYTRVIAADDDDRASFIRVPLHDAPSSGALGVSLPEPVEDDDDDR